ncbi:MAG: spermidine synthase [Verrucomicrobiota bacterium]
MKPFYEELDFQPTPIGDLILRRRRMDLLDGLIVHEVLLGDGYLMSSLFHDVEEALADLGLAAVQGEKLDVVVGGLGLGYTAVAALKDKRVAELLVVDVMAPVISWHEKEMVPLGKVLNEDARCRFVHADFFALAAAPEIGFDERQPGRKFHAVLLDIDHSPKNLLTERNAFFYSAEGLRQLAAQLHPSGVFALWSDDAPDDDFLHHLAEVFENSRAHVVKFNNPLLDKESESTVYVARR